MNFSVIFHSFWIKFIGAMGSVYGWLIAVFVALLNFFGGYETAIIAVVFCVLSDLFWGIWAALKQGKFAQSDLVRNTTSKFSAYAMAVILAIFMDKLSFDTVLCTSIFTIVICVAEIWSISGNILIVNPNIVFFRLLRPALKGELARKLQVSEEEVEEALNNLRKEV